MTLFAKVSAAICSIIILIAMSEDLSARTMAKPVVALKCAPSDVAAASELCKAVERALREISNGHVLRRLRENETAPNRPMDKYVKLSVERASGGNVSLRLDWRQGNQAIVPGNNRLFSASASNAAEMKAIVKELIDEASGLKVALNRM